MWIFFTDCFAHCYSSVFMWIFLLTVLHICIAVEASQQRLGTFLKLCTRPVVNLVHFIRVRTYTLRLFGRACTITYAHSHMDKRALIFAHSHMDTRALTYAQVCTLTYGQVCTFTYDHPFIQLLVQWVWHTRVKFCLRSPLASTTRRCVHFYNLCCQHQG